MAVLGRVFEILRIRAEIGILGLDENPLLAHDERRASALVQ
jgi:hypothetical protein